jgi:metal-responsive CopG/Arc/MetJ family transcriptional regulator
MVSVRMPQATLAALDARCAELGCSRSEYVAEMLAVALAGAPR